MRLQHGVFRRHGQNLTDLFVNSFRIASLARPKVTILMRLLVINPNSTKDITDGIAESLNPHCPPNATLSYFTAPSHAPPSIRDYVTGIQTAAACFDELVKTRAFNEFDGFLVCCCELSFPRFSKFPVTPRTHVLVPV